MTDHNNLDRRGALVGMAGAMGAAAFGGSAAHAQIAAESPPLNGKPVRFAYVGCRTTRERNARGDGIGVYRVDAAGKWTQVQLAKCENPSFLAFNPAGTMLYTVHGDMTDMSAYRVDNATGQISFVNKVPCGGRNPVHLAFDSSGRFLVVANHITRDGDVSNVACVAVKSDGSLGAITSRIELPGKIGPHRTEQPFSKPHQCVFDSARRFFVVPDKGLDRIFTLSVDAAGKLTRVQPDSAMAREGSGPRHAIFHPTLPVVFVANELTSTLMACRFDPATGAITPTQELSTLPDTFIAMNRVSEIDISPDGRFVYVSNRGHDSIAAFAFDRANGRLTSVGWTKAMGETPRFFTVSPDGRSLFVANETSDTIVRFVRHANNGVIARGEVIAKTGSPTCILFA